MFDLIAFDADDTLWHNEILYHQAQEKLGQLLAGYHDSEWIEQRLYQTEMRNLQHFGYGVKSFMLSMIETAIELTEGRIGGEEIQRVIDLGKDMLQADVDLLDHTRETVAALSSTHRLILVTKGDLLDQQKKLDRSGLGPYFQDVEIVSEKTTEMYRGLLQSRAVDPARFLMVGNSLRSDILPVLALGGSAVYVPYDITWEHELVTDESAVGKVGFHQIEHLGQLPDLVERISQD